MGTYDRAFSLFGAKPLGQIAGSALVGLIVGLVVSRRMERDGAGGSTVAIAIGGAVVGLIAGLFLAWNDVRAAKRAADLAANRPTARRVSFGTQLLIWVIAVTLIAVALFGWIVVRSML